jgi:hypothetical protein
MVSLNTDPKSKFLRVFSPHSQSAYFVDRDNLSWWLPRSSDPSDKPKGPLLKCWTPPTAKKKGRLVKSDFQD